MIALLGVSTAVAYDGSAFAAVSAAVFDRPYAKLPTSEVEASALGPEGDDTDNRLRRAARRTLTVQDDLFAFQMVASCFKPTAAALAESGVSLSQTGTRACSQRERVRSSPRIQQGVNQPQRGSVLG